MKVNLFVTCLCDAVRADVAKQSVLLLERLGCEVEFPENQSCCGMPAINSGYIASSLPAMQSMIKAFEVNDDPIIVPAGSCGAMLKNYPLYLKEDEWHERAVAVANRVHELTSFIVDELGVEDVGAHLDGKAVYHPSCSLLRKMHVIEQPLKLLSHVRGLSLLPIKNQETCCGFGGTFSVKMPEISAAMVTEKVRHISDVSPDYLIGADVSCLINIGGRMHREGKPIKVMHIAQVLMSH